MIDFYRIQAFEDGPAARVAVRNRMRKVVSGHGKGERCAIGYDKYVSYYSAGFDGGRFLGSSLNRKFKEDEKKYKKKILAALSEGNAKVEGKAIDWGFVEAARDYGSIFREAIGAIKENASACRANKIASVVSRNGVPYSVHRDENRIHKFGARSRVKVRNKAFAFYRSCGSHKTFVTLTFLSSVSDKSAVSILNTFLTQIRKKYSDFEYLWVAERQSETKNIHFHMICNRRLPVAVYNPLWVLCQYNAGITGKNKYGREISIEEIRRAEKSGKVGKIFNPFDIKHVSSINNLSMYLTKYIVKQDENESFGCANWHCSRRVSTLFTSAICGPDVFEKCKGLSNWRVDKESGEMFAPRPSVGLFWLSIPVYNKDIIIEDLREMEQVNKWLLQGENIFPDWSHFQTLDDDEYRKLYISPSIGNLKKMQYEN